MPLFAFGVNHQTAPVAIRERVSFPLEHLPVALHDLTACGDVKEAAIVSTCNRTDVYCGLGGDKAAPVACVEWLSRYHGMATKDLKPYLYTHQADSAVRHMMRVASGLDSMILGEPQILGQIKDAYKRAVASGTVGQILGKLFQYTFSVAKRVRTDTAIGSSPVSVAFAAVTLARQIFGELNAYTALLIGAGETVELAARHLRKNNLGRMIIANRTLETAHHLAAEFDAYAIELGEIPAHIADADIVVASTAAPTTILKLDDVRRALHARKRRPVFMVDLAVPRDIDAEVGELEDVYLYTVDDLRDVIEENLQSRRESARQAEEIIDTEVSHFMGWLGALDAVATIRAFRDDAEQVRQQVLDKARRQLAKGVPPEHVMQYLAHTLTNKLLHAPSVNLRAAGAQRRDDIIEAARVLFELPPELESGREP